MSNWDSSSSSIVWVPPRRSKSLSRREHGVFVNNGKGGRGSTFAPTMMQGYPPPWWNTGGGMGHGCGCCKGITGCTGSTGATGMVSGGALSTIVGAGSTSTIVVTSGGYDPVVIPNLTIIPTGSVISTDDVGFIDTTFNSLIGAPATSSLVGTPGLTLGVPTSSFIGFNTGPLSVGGDPLTIWMGDGSLRLDSGFNTPPGLYNIVITINVPNQLLNPTLFPGSPTTNPPTPAGAVPGFPTTFAPGEASIPAIFNTSIAVAFAPQGELFSDLTAVPISTGNTVIGFNSYFAPQSTALGAYAVLVFRATINTVTTRWRLRFIYDYMVTFANTS